MLQRTFGLGAFAGLAMLAECVEKCPEDMWLEGKHPRTFWRIAFHAAFFTHLYLGQNEAAFQPWPGRREGIHHVLWEEPAHVEPYELPEGAESYRRDEILDYLRTHGASFFSALHQGTGGGFPQEAVDALWELVWKGLVTNDTLHPLRAFVSTEDKRPARRGRPEVFRSRRLLPPTAEGRWSAVPVSATAITPTEYMTALAQQLLTRHGVVTRETVTHEAIAGGFSTIYTVLKAMEDAGRVRRGYFVAGLGGAQFAMPAALDLLRSMRDVTDGPRTVVMAATDPANPYGSILKWPETGEAVTPEDVNAAPAESSRGPTRTVGSIVILVDGAAAAYLKRGERELLLFAPPDEPRRSTVIRQVARMLRHLAAVREEGRRGMLVAEINSAPATAHPAARLFIEEGFLPTAMGLQARVPSGRNEELRTKN